ncbi:MAG TPA: BrnT family toxin [Micavibrio sp.]
MEFEWDDKKNWINIRKHGIDFEMASRIFGNPVLTYIDTRNDYGEIRSVSIGLVEGAAILVVTHTDRQGKIRIISARPASRKERDEYYGQI